MLATYACPTPSALSSVHDQIHQYNITTIYLSIHVCQKRVPGARRHGFSVGSPVGKARHCIEEVIKKYMSGTK
jgi:hypothetical protein